MQHSTTDELVPGAQPQKFSCPYGNNKLSLATVLIAPKLSQVLDYTWLKKNHACIRNNTIRHFIHYWFSDSYLLYLIKKKPCVHSQQHY